MLGQSGLLLSFTGKKGNLEYLELPIDSCDTALLTKIKLQLSDN